LQNGRLVSFKLRQLLAALVMAMVCCGSAGAEELSLVPSLRLRQAYNDNIFFDSTGEIDDFRTTVSPGLDLLRRGERLNAGLSARLDGDIYADTSGLNAVDQHYSGNVNYRVTPRLGFGANGGYSRDNQPDRELLETGLLFGSQLREGYRFGISGNYLSSETTGQTLALRFERDDFDEEAQSDSEVYTASLLHTWNMSRLFRETVGRVSFGYAHGDFSTSEVDSYSVTVGVEYDYSEHWRILADVGVRYTRTEFLALVFLNPFVAVLQEETDSRWSGVVDASLVYNGEYTTGRITVLNDVRQASGRGGTVLRTGITGSFSRRFTEAFSGQVAAAAFRNKTVSGLVALSDVDDVTVSVSPSIRYGFTRDLFFTAGYRLSWVDDRADDRQSKQNVLYAELYWQHPLFE
jgi:hypothetical protein